MKKSIVFLLILVSGIKMSLQAQTLYVNSSTGSDNAAGTAAQPLKSLEQAVMTAKSFSGRLPITIKIEPGFYVLTDKLKIGSPAGQPDTAMYTIEAAIMPDDTAWRAASLPVIASISGDNINTYFGHCAGFDVLRSNVSFKGLKFVGNANPNKWYYYPIERDSTKLRNLVVSQCYFIGERNSSAIQGAVYAEGGNGVHIDHCVFFGCKNAVLLFYAARDFSLTHSIIYGCYEAGLWYGIKTEPDAPFEFSNNVISHCAYVWASAGTGDHPLYHFKNSLISGNTNYLGVHNDGRVTAISGKDTHTESGIQRTGEVILVQAFDQGVPPDYLQLAPGSPGSDLDAGIFKREH